MLKRAFRFQLAFGKLFWRPPCQLAKLKQKNCEGEVVKFYVRARDISSSIEMLSKRNNGHLATRKTRHNKSPRHQVKLSRDHQLAFYDLT